MPMAARMARCAGLAPCHVEHSKGDPHKDHGCAEVWLQENEEHRDANHHQGAEQTRPGIKLFFLGKVLSQRNDHPEFGQLRNLHRHGADVKPAFRAINLPAEDQHRP